MNNRPIAAENTQIELIVRAVMFRGGRILACKNLKHGYFYLPGGHVEFGEAAATALARELMEECGLAIVVGRLGLVSENVFEQGAKRRPRHEVNVVFHVEHPAGKPWPETVASREDGIAFEWIELAALPETDLRPEEMKAWLAAGCRDEGAGAGWVSRAGGR